MSPEPASQLDRLLDLGVFAPLGFLLEREEVMTDLAAAGRRQVAFTRSLGRAALKALAKGVQSPQQSPKAAPTPGAGPAARSAEIANFDAMSAREIISIAKNATQSQLRWIEGQETVGKNRVTVLRAVADRT